jgi:hypothetical protein
MPLTTVLTLVQETQMLLIDRLLMHALQMSQVIILLLQMVEQETIQIHKMNITTDREWLIATIIEVLLPTQE